MDSNQRHQSPSEETWSALALLLPPIEPPASERDRLLERLRGPERYAPFAAETARVFGLTLDAAREALALIHDTSAWHAGFAPGSALLSTPALQGKQAVISRLPAGFKIPQHAHAGQETTLILDGVLIEDGTRMHGAGAVLDMAAGTHHELAVAEDESCLVVFRPGLA